MCVGGAPQVVLTKYFLCVSTWNVSTQSLSAVQHFSSSHGLSSPSYFSKINMNEWKLVRLTVLKTELQWRIVIDYDIFFCSCLSKWRTIRKSNVTAGMHSFKFHLLNKSKVIYMSNQQTQKLIRTKKENREKFTAIKVCLILEESWLYFHDTINELQTEGVETSLKIFYMFTAIVQCDNIILSCLQTRLNWI